MSTEGHASRASRRLSSPNEIDVRDEAIAKTCHAGSLRRHGYK